MQYREILGPVFAVVLGAVLVRLTMAAARYRHALRMDAQPDTHPIDVAALSRRFPGRCAEFLQSLAPLGFEVAGAAEFVPNPSMWRGMQLMMVHRANGHRASLFLTQVFRYTVVSVAFATEFADGLTVRTMMHATKFTPGGEPILRPTPADGITTEFLDWIGLAEAFQKHVERVSHLAPDRGGGCVPSASESQAYVVARLASAAPSLIARSATSLRLRLNDSKTAYAPIWEDAIVATLRQQLPWRWFLRLRPSRTKLSVAAAQPPGPPDPAWQSPTLPIEVTSVDDARRETK